jgi:hypothetical protein
MGHFWPGHQFSTSRTRLPLTHSPASAKGYDRGCFSDRRFLGRVRFGRAARVGPQPQAKVREVAAQRNVVADPRRFSPGPPAHPDLVWRRIRPAQRARIVSKHLCRFPEQLSHLVWRHSVARVTERLDSPRHSFLIGQRRCRRRPGKEQPGNARGGHNRDRSCTPGLRHFAGSMPGVGLRRLRANSGVRVRSPSPALTVEVDRSAAMATL